jgi:hypothetical protein
MSEAVKKKLLIYFVFLVVGSAIGLGVSVVFDPILEVAGHADAE